MQNTPGRVMVKLIWKNRKNTQARMCLNNTKDTSPTENPSELVYFTDIFLALRMSRKGSEFVFY
jgi:hypothetical protein